MAQGQPDCVVSLHLSRAMSLAPRRTPSHVKTLSYNQSLLSSPPDSIESIATPQEADFDDEQLRALLASPRYLSEREAGAERSQVYHSERESLMSRSSQGLIFMSTGRSVALFSQQSWLNQGALFRERYA